MVHIQISKMNIASTILIKTYNNYRFIYIYYLEASHDMYGCALACAATVGDDWPIAYGGYLALLAPS